MRPLPSLPRIWTSVDLPGYRHDPDGRTYGNFPVESLPPIDRALDDKLSWLLAEPLATEWAILNQAEIPRFEEKRSRALGKRLPDLPKPFSVFIGTPAPASRIRSATGSYLDFADHLVSSTDGGQLIHFLSDQQWSMHWLLYMKDNAEAVVATFLPYGFKFDEGESHPDYNPASLAVFDPCETDASVCSDSFLEFIYRYWIENEIYFRLRAGYLTDEQRRYAEYYKTP